ncbi:MAG TPA: DMT family transporter [Bacteroidales bacterium]|jgi:drug/metabolite transporter (DMT)-like permease|nr:DMT family transporter [Bacteroidales bacterium]
MNSTGRSYLYGILAILFWATIPTAFKLCLARLEILPMLTIASVASAAAIFIIIVAGNKLPLLKKNTMADLLHSALLGLINPFLYYLILLKAYQILPAQVAQPLNMIWPIILVFLSVPVLKQRIEKKSFAALLVSFLGVCVISSQGKILSPGHADLTGVLLATGSSVFWAFYFILNIKDKREESVKLFLNFTFASVYLIFALLITRSWPENIEASAVAPAIYIGLFEMGITFYLWLKALQLAPTTDKISNLVYLAPFLSLILVHFILHEPVFFTTPAGLLLIITGIMIQNRKRANV